MAKESFVYLNHAVEVDTVQPLFGDGWLWRIFVDGLLVRESHRHIFTSESQAIEGGISESKRLIDLLGCVGSEA